MAALDFPASPAVNDTYTSGSQTWKWNGITWDLITGTVVNTVAGTTDQILVNGATAAVSGNATLSLPTNVAMVGDISFPNTTNVGIKNVAGTSYFHLDRTTGNSQWLTKATAQAYIDADTFNVRSNGGTSRLVINSTQVTTPLQLASTIATGTAPLSVTSTTMVNNLNAQYVNGFTPEYCRVRNSTSISLTHNTVTALTFDTEDSDSSGGMHSVATNTGRINFPTAGTYVIMLNVRFAANNIGVREVTIRNSAGTSLAAARGSAAVSSTAGTTYTAQSVDMRLFVSTIHTVTAGDWVDAVAFQNSGGALNAEAVGNFSPCFSAYRIA